MPQKPIAQRPPLDLLIVFVRVAETGGFTAAARALGLSKATVSKQVAELENALGVQLFHRTTRRLALTEAGERALARAERVLEEADALAEEASEARESPKGRLRIAAPLTFGVDYLAPLLPDFMAAFPEISLEISFDDRKADLIGERFDAALRISGLIDSSFVARQVTPIELHLVAAPSYWKRHGKPTHPDQLAAHASLLYANAPHAVAWRFLRDGKEAQVRIDGPLSMNNGAAGLPFLRAGLGIALLPDFIAWRDLASGALEPAMEQWRAPPLILHLLTPHGRAQPRRLRVFSDFVHEHFGAGRAPWQTGEKPARA